MEKKRLFSALVMVLFFSTFAVQMYIIFLFHRFVENFYIIRVILFGMNFSYKIFLMFLIIYIFMSLIVS